MEKKEVFKMLRKDGVGQPFPYSEALAARSDMVVCLMTREELAELTGQKADSSVSGVSVKPRRVSLGDVKLGRSWPGPGWVRNKRGHWVRDLGRISRLKRNRLDELTATN